jgi:hypothetical protein
MSYALDDRAASPREPRLGASVGLTSEFRSSGVQEFRSSGVQEFRSSGVQEFRSSGVQEFRSSAWSEPQNYNQKGLSPEFLLSLSWLVAPELLQLLELLNSFPIAFRPGNGPFIVKSCHSGNKDVIDVAGFSKDGLAKIILKLPVKYES